ncbi:MAG: PqqD family protein [Bacteroidales bacterium]|nr:PqqD family protein [Bacteroidales bacterium]
MKRKDGFVLREVCGEKVIVGEGLGAIDFGKLISLNDTAAWLWDKAGELGEFDAETLAEALCEIYEVDKDTALTDVKAMLSQWLGLGILED